MIKRARQSISTPCKQQIKNRQMAKFKKGESGHPEGRTRGVQNKITKELRERIKDFLEDKWDGIERDFDKLKPEQRVMLFEKLLQYILPRLSYVDLDADIDLKTLSDESLDRIIEKLLTTKKK
jgi:ribosome-binding ATPase YchF (GTP1/OBG family)